jgi:Protein of unknown function (DUF3168)
MSGAIIALRKAIHALLTADTVLLGLLGGPRVHDEPPRAAKGLYVVFGAVNAEDWSSTGDDAAEQRFDLVIWGANTGGTATALLIGARIEALLHDASLTLTGHRLVSLRWQATSSARDERSNLPRIAVTFRAVTEVLV